MNAKSNRVPGGVGSALALTAALIALIGASGCASHSRIYTVVSYPPGATIFIDQVEKGQTDTERLAVDFGASTYRSLRLEKEGYQPEGMVLHSGIREDRIEFHLKKAPDPESILGRLEEIQIEVRRLSGQFAELREDRALQDQIREETYRQDEFQQDEYREN